MAYDPLTSAIIGVESGGRANAKNPNSSATGAGQFISETWLDMLAKNRPDLAALPRAQQLALRNDPQLSAQMTAAYARENQNALARAGLPVNPGTAYLSHFAGQGGAKAVLSADPSTPVSRILEPGAVAANPFVRGMTAQDLVNWATRKMGGRSAATPAGSAPGPGSPTMQLPPEAGGGARSGRLGLSGVEASQRPAATMQLPQQAPPPDPTISSLELIKALLAQQQAAQTPSQAQRPPPPPPPQLPEPPPPPQFDAERFFALLNRRA